MLGHMDGTESNALSMKRRLDEHKDDEGQSDKRHKNEQAASTSGTSGKAAAPKLHLAASKKPRKAPNLCEQM